MCGWEGVHLIRFLLIMTKSSRKMLIPPPPPPPPFLSSLFSSPLPPLSYPPFSLSHHLQADNSFPPNKEVLEALKTIPEVKPYMKKLMPFVQHTKVCPAPVKPQNGLEKSCCTHLVELICLVVRICISRLVVGAARGEGTRGPGPHTSF